MMRLRAVSLRSSASLYLSPSQVCSLSQPYSRDSYKHNTQTDTCYGPRRELTDDHEAKGVIGAVFANSMSFGTKQWSSEIDPSPFDDPYEPKPNIKNNQTLFARIEGPEQCLDEFSDDIERLYGILQRFHSRVPKLELALNQSGIVMRRGLTERVLRRCGDAGNLGYRFYAWASKHPDFRPSTKVYKSMVRCLGKMRQFGAVWALLEEMRTDNPQMITPEIFVVLMRRFASARMVKNAVQVLDEMPKYGCEADGHAFGCLLDALCKNGSVREAASLFEEIRENFEPDLKHFTSLLYGWCREGKLDEAKLVLRKMTEAGFEPDVVVYNNLIGGYAAAEKMTDAYVLLEEMREKGKEECFPNAASYTILVQSLCKRGKMEEAARVFSEMERSGCELDVVAYTTLISGFCKCGKISKAYETLREMTRHGLRPNETTYLHIALAHERKEQLEECLDLTEEMRKNECFPDAGIYRTLIRLSAKLGEVKEAVRFWNEMEANGMRPMIDSYVVMIRAFVDQGHLIEACHYFKEMVGRGMWAAPPYGTMHALVNRLAREGRVEMAKEVWEAIVRGGGEVNVAAWTIWIEALFSAGHVKEACNYCVQMTEAGEMPEPDTFAKLMLGLKSLYNRIFAAELTEKVRKLAEQKGVTFKMYKRRGVTALKELEKETEKRRIRNEARKTRISHRRPSSRR